MRKEAPKSKFNRFKMKRTESFCETTWCGALENAYRAQIWERKWSRKGEGLISDLMLWAKSVWLCVFKEMRVKGQDCPGFGLGGRPATFSGRPTTPCTQTWLVASNGLQTWSVVFPRWAPRSLQILVVIGVPGTRESTRKVHFSSRNPSAGASTPTFDARFIVTRQEKNVSFLSTLWPFWEVNRGARLSRTRQNLHFFACRFVSSMHSSLHLSCIVMHVTCILMHTTCIVVHVSWVLSYPHT